MRNLISCFLERHGISCEEVILHFVGTKKIQALHKEFFEDPSPTDCMSFPIDRPDKAGLCELLGEVFICPATAKKFVGKQGGSLEKEVFLYIIHGLLHLIGYDDKTESQKKEMRHEEEKFFNFFYS